MGAPAAISPCRKPGGQRAGPLAQVQRTGQVVADAEVATVDLHGQLGVFVPFLRRTAQGRGQQQEAQRFALQGENAQAAPGQQAPKLVHPVVFADCVEAPVQDALAGFQSGQQPAQGLGGLLRLLGKVAGLGFGQVLPQSCQNRLVLAHQQLHREVQGVQGTGEGPQLGFVQLQPHHLAHRQLHPVQAHRPVVFQVGQHEEQGQGGRRLGFRRPFDLSDVAVLFVFGAGGLVRPAASGQPLDVR